MRIVCAGPLHIPRCLASSQLRNDFIGARLMDQPLPSALLRRGPGASPQYGNHWASLRIRSRSSQSAGNLSSLAHGQILPARLVAQRQMLLGIVAWHCCLALYRCIVQNASRDKYARLQLSRPEKARSMNVSYNFVRDTIQDTIQNSSLSTSESFLACS